MDIASLLMCPIACELMDDPVTVHETGSTYDRTSLSESLRLYYDLDPSTGQRFGHPLHFTANVALLQIVELAHLDAQLPRSPSDSEAGDSLETSIMLFLRCPISLEPMEDPVMMQESGVVYDRKSLCFALLARPYMEPHTGQTYDHPLQFTSCVTTRALIAHLYGENQLRRHDDSLFHKFYRMATTRTTEATRTTVPGSPSCDQPHPPPTAPMEEDSSRTSIFDSTRPDPPGSAEIPRGDEERRNASSVPARPPEGRSGDHRPIPAARGGPPSAAQPPARTNKNTACKVTIVIIVVVFVFFFVIHAAAMDSPRIIGTTRATSKLPREPLNPTVRIAPPQQRNLLTKEGGGKRCVSIFTGPSGNRVSSTASDFRAMMVPTAACA